MARRRKTTEFSKKFMISISGEDGYEIKPIILEKKSKHKFEFQEVCTELEPIYGKRIWTLPYMAGFTEYKIRKAHGIAQSRGIIKINYLIGIIKKL